MTSKEFKQLIAESPNQEILMNQEFNWVYRKLGGEKRIKSITSLYDFAIMQKEQWEKVSVNSHVNNMTYYKKLVETISGYAESYFKSKHDNKFLQVNIFNQLQNLINNIASHCSDYHTSITQFIIKVSSEINENSGLGAYQYFSEENILGSNFDKDHLRGYILAYEFDVKGNSDIFRRKKIEATRLNKLDKEYQSNIDNFNTQLSENISASNASLKDHIAEMQSFKEAKEKLFNDWFVNSKGIFENFDKDSNKKVSDLEELYEKKLQLSKPAQYWDRKSKEYLRQATLMRNVLTIIVAIFGGFFAAILVIAPDWIFKTVFDGNAASIIRWSIVFITLVSLLAYVVKAITKVMFSSYHLARDAEERHTLTFFYLSLMNDPKSNLKDNEREMVIQSLFSRTDTGLLKGDSSPEMPSSEVLNKFISKS